MLRQIIGGASGGQVRSFEAEKQDREGEHSVGRQERGGRGVTEFGGLRQSSKLNHNYSYHYDYNYYYYYNYYYNYNYNNCNEI